MAEMIPRTIDPKVEHDPAKSAEVAIFKAIQGDENLKDWICLHSLNLESDRASTCGEIDFVLLGKPGIFCLEAKGGAIKCEAGRWISINREGKEFDIKNPFSQAKDARYIIKRLIERKFKDMKDKITFGYGVTFPHSLFPASSIECPKELAFDRGDRERPISTYLNRLRAYFEKKEGHPGITISDELKEQIKNILRPDFQIFEPLGFTVERTEEEIKSLTEEQYRVFDGLSSNPRILVKGQAGTGKTLLGRYHARDMAREGKKVLFLCFNILLGESLKAEIKREGLDDMVHVDRFFNYVQLTINDGKFKDEFEAKRKEIGETGDNVFFKRYYPEYFLKTARAKGAKFQQYDYLVIDEAQDVMCGSIMAAADAALKGGLKEGEWCIFYDPDCQADVFSNWDEKYLKALIKECKPVQYNLPVNCRNTKKIVEETSAITGFDMVKAMVERGEDVKYIYYADIDEMKEKASSYINNLLRQEIKHEDIHALFMGGHKNIEIALRGLPGIKTELLTEENLNTAMPETIRTCSIQKYKGLESKVILVVGLEKLEKSKTSVYYVGMTRAKSLLCIFAHEKLKDAIEQIHKAKKS